MNEAMLYRKRKLVYSSIWTMEYYGSAKMDKGSSALETICVVSTSSLLVSTKHAKDATGILQFILSAKHFLTVIHPKMSHLLTQGPNLLRSSSSGDENEVEVIRGGGCDEDDTFHNASDNELDECNNNKKPPAMKESMNKSTMNRWTVPPPRSWCQESSTEEVIARWRYPSDSGRLRLRSKDWLFVEADHPIEKGTGVLYFNPVTYTLHHTTVWRNMVYPGAVWVYMIDLYELPEPTSQSSQLFYRFTDDLTPAIPGVTEPYPENGVPPLALAHGPSSSEDEDEVESIRGGGCDDDDTVHNASGNELDECDNDEKPPGIEESVNESTTAVNEFITAYRQSKFAQHGSLHTRDEFCFFLLQVSVHNNSLPEQSKERQNQFN